LLKQNMNVKIASLPKGEDPDSFVQKNGKDAFLDAISRAVSFLEFQTSVYEEQGYFNDPVKSAEAIRELVKPVALLSDDLKKNFLLKSIAEKFGLREKLLEAELEKAEKGKQSSVQREAVKDKKEAAAESTTPVIPMPPAEFRNEQEIIILMFNGNEQITRYLLDHMEPAQFRIPFHSQLAQMVYDALVNDESLHIAKFMDQIQDEKLADYLREITVDEHHISEVWDLRKPENKEKRLLKYAHDLIKTFLLFAVDKQFKEMQLKIENAESEQQVFNLLDEQKKLYQKRKEIEKGNF